MFCVPAVCPVLALCAVCPVCLLCVPYALGIWCVLCVCCAPCAVAGEWVLLRVITVSRSPAPTCSAFISHKRLPPRVRIRYNSVSFSSLSPVTQSLGSKPLNIYFPQIPSFCSFWSQFSRLIPSFFSHPPHRISYFVQVNQNLGL